MRKKLLTALLLIAISASTIACGGEAPGNSDNPKQSETTANPQPESGSVSATSTAEPKQSESKQEELDVELTVPADFVGESTQEELDALCKENGFKSIVLNDDGSATYIMTKKQHQELMAGYRADILDTLNDMIGSEEYPNITNIEANDNFSEFTVTTKNTELDLAESFSVIAFYMAGGMYNAFNGEDIDNISVTFVNADSGEVITTVNSSDMTE